MEVGSVGKYIYSDTELDLEEGQIIEELKANSQPVIPDPDEWLDGEIEQNILLTTVDAVINWGRRSSLWTAICFPACCAFEFIAANGPRFDLARFGMEILRASPRQADLMITAGTLTWKMAPNVRRIYNHIIPVDVYVPGCPPRPEALIYGIQMLQKKIARRRNVDIGKLIRR